LESVIALLAEQRAYCAGSYGLADGS
jgi:hypothetical protein